jgi:hypothetical protein
MGEESSWVNAFSSQFLPPTPLSRHPRKMEVILTESQVPVSLPFGAGGDITVLFCVCSFRGCGWLDEKLYPLSSGPCLGKQDNLPR